MSKIKYEPSEAMLKLIKTAKKTVPGIREDEVIRIAKNAAESDKRDKVQIEDIAVGINNEMIRVNIQSNDMEGYVDWSDVEELLKPGKANFGAIEYRVKIEGYFTKGEKYILSIQDKVNKLKNEINPAAVTLFRTALEKLFKKEENDSEVVSLNDLKWAVDILEKTAGKQKSEHIIFVASQVQERKRSGEGNAPEPAHDSEKKEKPAKNPVKKKSIPKPQKPIGDMKDQFDRVQVDKLNDKNKRAYELIKKATKNFSDFSGKNKDMAEKVIAAIKKTQPFAISGKKAEKKDDGKCKMEPTEANIRKIAKLVKDSLDKDLNATIRRLKKVLRDPQVDLCLIFRANKTNQPIPLSVRGQQAGTRKSKSIDKKEDSYKAGKRLSPNGRIYYEYRQNRSDRTKRYKL